MKVLVGLSFALAALALSARAGDAPGIGKPPAELNAKKWYNTPPLTLEDLKGKAVLLQVFRTW